MSDTPAEMQDHRVVVNICKSFNTPGNVLIGGLGIGMVLDNIAHLDTVNHVHVLELSQEVIDLVWPTYKAKYGDKITIEKVNVFERKPKLGEKYDYIWWDVWDNITSDNLDQFETLRRRWCRRTPKQDFWCEKECKRSVMYQY